MRAEGPRDIADEENGGESEGGEDALDELPVDGEGNEGTDLRMMTMSPSEWAEKMASTTSSSGTAHPRAVPSGRSRVSSRMMSRVTGRDSGDDLVLIVCARPLGCRRETG